MKRDEIMGVFHRCDAIIEDSHIVYTSGRHGRAYVSKDTLYTYPGDTVILVEEMIRRIGIRCRTEPVGVIVAPAVAGALLGFVLAYKFEELNVQNGSFPRFAYVEKQSDGSMAFKRGYADVVLGLGKQNRPAWVAEDIVTTGCSVKKTVKAIEALGVEVAGVSALCNRGGVTAAELGVPVFEPLVDIQMDSWPEDECPMCAEGVKINTSVGHGAEYLARKAAEKST